PPASADPGRLVNLSVRNRTTRGTGVLIAGFSLDGTTAKELVVRGIGPTLGDFGVTGVVESTALEVYTSVNTTTPLLENSGWTAASGDGDGRELGAFPLPAGSADSVVRSDFAAGGYTAQVLPHDETTAPGAALVEIYDAAIEELA